MSMMMLMAETYPRTKNTKHSAFCERIPIHMFDIAESALRVEMRAQGYRAMYRGPRVSNNTYGMPSMTRRCDATHVLLYRSN
jgi:hypothetical protein